MHARTHKYKLCLTRMRLCNRQSGWVYLCTDFGGCKRPVPYDGWFKARSLELRQTNKLVDNVTCPYPRCPCKKQHTPVRRKHARCKAKGKRKHRWTRLTEG